MHDRATAAKFAEVWRGEDANAQRLPREPVKVKGVEPGLREPTVMVEAAGAPTAFASLIREPGHRTRLRVLLGRLAFDVRDIGAYRSTTAAFSRAAGIAEEVFLDGGAASPTNARAATAAEIGGRAFISPVGSTYQRSVRARSMPTNHEAPRSHLPHQGGPTR
jgi:hypothetical protein